MKKSVNLIRQTLSPLYDIRETNAITDLILEEVCGISRVDRIMNPNQELSEENTKKISEICNKLSSGMPIQYVLGYEYFMGNRFYVNENVLIPRPETAELVEWIVEVVKEKYPLPIIHYPLSILDIGTGSGCIAISLAALINNSYVIADDLSTAALETAKLNAKSLNIDNIEFINMDILSERNSRFQHPLVDKFDIIVSNPPYVMNKEKADINRNVLDYEPHLALFVPDEDPLVFYRAIATFGKNNLRNGGMLFFEINAAFGNETCRLLANYGYSNIELRKDINGRDRMIKAIYETY